MSKIKNNKNAKTIKLYEAVFFGTMTLLLVYLFVELLFK